MKIILITFIVLAQLATMQGSNDNTNLTKELDLRQFTDLLNTIDEVVSKLNQLFGLIGSYVNPVIDKINQIVSLF